MIRVSASLTGGDRIIATVTSLSEHARSDIRRVVLRNAHAILSEAKRRVPVKTRELLNTLRVEVGETGFNAAVMAGYGKLRRRQGRSRASRGTRTRGRTAGGSPGVYAPVVEFGSKGAVKRVARPFLFPAFRKQKSTFVSDVRKALDTATAKASKGAAA